MRHHIQIPARQRGAALAVGLILLLVLTVLAVSGMNTASMELVMAGNEQYRQRAFHAAESGIEKALVDLRLVPQTGAVMPATYAISGETTDQVTTTSQYMGDDLNISGFSAGKFVGLHYEIVSTGVSSRGSRSEQAQGAYVIQNAAGGGSFGSILTAAVAPMDPGEPETDPDDTDTDDDSGP